MSRLRPCPSCARHVRIGETTCPFCAAELDAAGPAPARDMGRVPHRAALVFFGAAATVARVQRRTRSGTDELVLWRIVGHHEQQRRQQQRRLERHVVERRKQRHVELRRGAAAVWQPADRRG